MLSSSHIVKSNCQVANQAENKAEEDLIKIRSCCCHTETHLVKEETLQDQL